MHHHHERDMYATRDEMIDRAVRKAKREDRRRRRPRPEPLDQAQAARGALVVLVVVALFLAILLSGCVTLACFGGYSSTGHIVECGAKIPT